MAAGKLFRNTVVRRVAISLVIFFGLIILVETRLRTANLPRLRPFEIITELDGRMVFRNRTNLRLMTFDGKQKVTTNGVGFRYRDIPKEKAGRIRRMFALGDSITFGYSVGDADTFSIRLEGMLNAGSGRREGPWEVVNAGVIGHTTIQGLLMLKSPVLAYRPDIVLINHSLNDSLRFDRHWDGWLGRSVSEIGEVPAWIVRLRNVMFNNVHICQWTLEWLYSVRRRVWVARNPDYDWDRESKAVPPRAYADNLREFARLGREHGFSVVFMTAPVQLKWSQVPAFAQPDFGSVAGCRERVRKARIALDSERDSEARSGIAYYMGQAHEFLRETGEARNLYLQAIRELHRQFDPRRSALEHNAIMREVGAEEGVLVVDAHACLSAHELSALDAPLAYSDQFHPNVLGHRLLARALFRALSARGFVGAARGRG